MYCSSMDCIRSISLVGNTGPVSSIGRTALSNYILQNILLGIIFYGYGLARFNQYSRFELLGIVGLFWIFQLVISHMWLTRFRQGPLEWFWRKMTYQEFNTQKVLDQ